MTQMDIYLNGPAGCSKTSDHFGLVQRTSAVLCTLHAGVDDGKTLGPCTYDRSAWYVLDEQVACEKSKKRNVITCTKTKCLQCVVEYALNCIFAVLLAQAVVKP